MSFWSEPGCKIEKWGIAPLEELLDALTPGAVLISVGSNSYGHPTEETLRRIAERGCGIYRTDLQGTLHLPIN